jgi:hypothetical protein
LKKEAMQLRPKTTLRIAAVGVLLALIAGTWGVRHSKVEKAAAAAAGKPAAAVTEPIAAASTPAPVSEPQAGMSTGPQVTTAYPPEPDATGDEASALASVVDSQLADFHEGITLGQWVGSRDQSENWQTSDGKAYVACRTYTNTEALPSGLQVTRTLYFYPPHAPTPAVLPTESGQRLIDQTCRLAELQVRTPTTVYRNGHFLEQFLQQHLGEKYGPGISLKKTRYRFEKEAAGWQVDSMKIITDYEPRARDNNGASMAAVEVSARLPAAYDDEEKPDHGMKMYRYRSIENDQFQRAIATAALDKAITDRVTRLFEASFAANATPEEPEQSSNQESPEAVLPVLSRWLGATKGLTPLRRAAALYVADRLLVASGGWGQPEWSDKAQADLRSEFEKLGANFTYYDPCGCYEYLGSWLNEARKLDPEETIGQMAVLITLARGGSPKIGNDEQPDVFRTVIADGEWLLAKNPNAANAAQIHFIIGDAYSDMVALAGGADPDYGESFTQQEGEAAREKALQQYRMGLAVDSTSENAKDAWLQAWHLRAGLLPETRFVSEGD